MTIRHAKRILILILGMALMISWSGVAFGQGKIPSTPEMTLEQAIQLAKANDETYKKAVLEVDRTDALAKYSTTSLTGYANTTGVSQGVGAAQIYAYYAADLTYQMAKKTLGSNEDRITNNTAAKYGAVVVAQANYEKAKSDAVLAERDYKIAQTKFQIGMLSELSYEAAKKTYDSSKKTLDTSKSSLDAAYANFNTLVGLWNVDRPVLTDGTSYEKLQVPDLESEVNRVQSTAPDVWLAEQSATLKDFQMNILVYTGSYSPYDARQDEVAQAKLDATKARETYASTTRSIYYSIKQVEDQYASLQNTVDQAEIAVRTQQALYNAGMGTQIELDRAINTYKSYNAQLIALKWSHTNLVNTFERPWAASASTTTSS